MTDINENLDGCPSIPAVVPIVPSRQEMFNRAWEGLKSQGFERCHSDNEPELRGRTDIPGCLYDNGKGHHCAWGWVDPEATRVIDGRYQTGTVGALASMGVGLAAHLNEGDLSFAADLQGAHDGTGTPERMQEALRRVATKYALVVPAEAPEVLP